MKLIPDWRLAWKFLSVQAAMLLALLSGIQGEVLPLFAPLVPDRYWPWVSGGLALIIVVLRLVSQDHLEKDRELMGLERLEANMETRPLAQEVVDIKTVSTDLNPMPAGRFERFIGAVFGLGIAAALLVLLGLLWSLR